MGPEGAQAAPKYVSSCLVLTCFGRLGHLWSILEIKISPRRHLDRTKMAERRILKTHRHTALSEIACALFLFCPVLAGLVLSCPGQGCPPKACACSRSLPTFGYQRVSRHIPVVPRRPQDDIRNGGFIEQFRPGRGCAVLSCHGLCCLVLACLVRLAWSCFSSMAILTTILEAKIGQRRLPDGAEALPTYPTKSNTAMESPVKSRVRCFCLVSSYPGVASPFLACFVL